MRIGTFMGTSIVMETKMSMETRTSRETNGRKGMMRKRNTWEGTMGGRNNTLEKIWGLNMPNLHLNYCRK